MKQMLRSYVSNSNNAISVKSSSWQVLNGNLDGLKVMVMNGSMLVNTGKPVKQDNGLKIFLNYGSYSYFRLILHT